MENQMDTDMQTTIYGYKLAKVDLGAYEHLFMMALWGVYRDQG